MVSDEIANAPSDKSPCFSNCVSRILRDGSFMRNTYCPSEENHSKERNPCRKMQGRLDGQHGKETRRLQSQNLRVLIRSEPLLCFAHRANMSTYTRRHQNLVECITFNQQSVSISRYVSSVSKCARRLKSVVGNIPGIVEQAD